jgi:hypothetical protein
MSQHYSNPARENEKNALPDVEIFQVTSANLAECFDGPGWYWWACFPGCLPDSEPFGPFATKSQAIADAQDCAD